MSAIFESRTVSISIDRPLEQVYAFLAQPENFRQWASGLGASLQEIAGGWRADTPEGPVTLRFTAPNAFGVLDHYVVLANGDEIYVPLRALANGDGCEIVFTLFRQPAMTDEKFAADSAWVARDLQTLKSLLEACPLF